MRNRKRGNGEGTIYQGGNGYWLAQITIGYDEHGRQKRKTFSGSTRAAVAEKMKTYLHDQQIGMLSETNKVTVSQYIDHWLSMKQREVKRSTYQSYFQTVTFHVKPGLGGIKLQKLTIVQLNNYFTEKINSGLRPATIKRHKAVIHSILDQAVRENIIFRNLADYCNSIKGEKIKMKTLETEEIRLLLDKAWELYAAKGNKFRYLYHAILLALATGVRRGELLALRWNNVNFEDKTITIKENMVELKGGIHFETPKTEASFRNISVDDIIMDELARFKTDREFVFETSIHTPVTPSNLSRGFRSLTKMIGLENIRFHDLRHAHATQLLANGVNIKQVSSRLGHQDIRITLQIYAHALPAQDREAASIMGSILKRGQ
jgi:integrase